MSKRVVEGFFSIQVFALDELNATPKVPLCLLSMK